MTYNCVNDILEKNIIPLGYEEYVPKLLLMNEQRLYLLMQMLFIILEMVSLLLMVKLIELEESKQRVGLLL